MTAEAAAPERRSVLSGAWRQLAEVCARSEHSAALTPSPALAADQAQFCYRHDSRSSACLAAKPHLHQALQCSRQPGPALACPWMPKLTMLDYWLADLPDSLLRAGVPDLASKRVKVGAPLVQLNTSACCPQGQQAAHVLHPDT